MTDENSDEVTPSIRVRDGGPLMAEGLPVRRARIVHSEHGEPLTWDIDEPLDTKATVALCRCGDSESKPFCDGTHRTAGFDGTESAAGTYDERANNLGGTGITVRDDRSICVHAGFCGTRVSNIWKLAGQTDESVTRLQVINMVEKCPSGAITYRFDGDEVDQEPDLPTQVAVVDDGPFWVEGGVSVTLSDGTELETRNRTTLCRCGASANKPLCDGAHKEAAFRDS